MTLYRYISLNSQDMYEASYNLFETKQEAEDAFNAKEDVRAAAATEGNPYTKRTLVGYEAVDVQE